MKKLGTLVIAAAALSASSAYAADMPVKAAPAPAPAAAPSPLDIAFGGAVMSDYNFRGISQSNKGPSGGAYVEPQLTIGFGTIYVGLAAWAIDWPSGVGYGFTAPTAEVDFYGGWRNSWGPFSIDLGGIYYYYPNESFNGFTSNSDFWEIYAKAAYAITPDVSIGANVFYTPNLLNYSVSFGPGGSDVNALYASVTGKWVLPVKLGEVGAFVSGEFGHWWIDDSNWTAAGLFDPSYNYWNAGFALTYKVFTLDFRYHGTDMSRLECTNYLLVGPNNGANNWCDDTFIVSLKFDTALSQLK
jgi:uncharacterized protein (TIGR02001 family)